MTRRRDNEMTRRRDDDNDHGVKERAIARMEDGDSDRRGGARHEFLGQAGPSSPFDEAPPFAVVRKKTSMLSSRIDGAPRLTPVPDDSMFRPGHCR